MGEGALRRCSARRHLVNAAGGLAGLVFLCGSGLAKPFPPTSLQLPCQSPGRRAGPKCAVLLCPLGQKHSQLPLFCQLVLRLRLTTLRGQESGICYLPCALCQAHASKATAQAQGAIDSLTSQPGRGQIRMPSRRWRYRSAKPGQSELLPRASHGQAICLSERAALRTCVLLLPTASVLALNLLIVDLQES